MHRIVCDVSCYTVLLPKFSCNQTSFQKLCQKVCTIWRQVCGYTNKWTAVALTAHHTPTLSNGTSSISMRTLFVWEFVHPSRCSQSSPPNWTRVGPISPSRTISRYGISAQNSVVLQDLCRSVCEPQTCYMDAHAPDILHFVLMTQTWPFRCGSRINDFLQNDSKSPNSSNSSSVRRSLQWVLLLCRMEPIRKLFK
jgi:hypothetical protein